MKKLIIASLCLLIQASVFGQQDPIYSLHLINPFVINPAFAGHYDRLHAQLSYRTQWVGLEGNARTINFNGHTSVNSNKAGVGIQVLQDVIGESKNSEFQASFSYRINFATSILSFGMQAGVMNFASNPDELTIRHSGDPYFTTYSEFKFNTGAGLMLSSPKYSFGVSAPRMLPSKINQSGEEIEVYRQSLYFTGAYIVPLTQEVNFQPGVLLRAVKGVPLSADVHANFLILNSYTAGVFTRNLNTYGLSGRAKFRNIQLGYIFEIPTKRSVGSQFTSHEIMLAVRTNIFKFHDSMAADSF